MTHTPHPRPRPGTYYGRPAALKLLVLDEESAAAILNEVRLALKLNHRNLVRLLDCAVVSTAPRGQQEPLAQVRWAQHCSVSGASACVHVANAAETGRRDSRSGTATRSADAATLSMLAPPPPAAGSCCCPPQDGSGGRSGWAPGGFALAGQPFGGPAATAQPAYLPMLPGSLQQHDAGCNVIDCSGSIGSAGSGSGAAKLHPHVLMLPELGQQHERRGGPLALTSPSGHACFEVWIAMELCDGGTLAEQVARGFQYLPDSHQVDMVRAGKQEAAAACLPASAGAATSCVSARARMHVRLCRRVHHSFAATASPPAVSRRRPHACARAAPPPGAAAQPGA